MRSWVLSSALIAPVRAKRARPGRGRTRAQGAAASGRPRPANHLAAPSHEEAAALALPSDAAVLVREDIYQDRRGNPVDFTRTVWPGDTTRLVLGN